MALNLNWSLLIEGAIGLVADVALIAGECAAPRNGLEGLDRSMVLSNRSLRTAEG